MILSSHGIIASQITQFVGLLDVYSGAAAAYSLRRLRGAYTGSAIEVRRTNNDVADIGFTSAGELDTTALLAFTGTGALDNGFITKWYDQSGNARNATQTTAANQPQIVSAGSVLTENGKPTIDFNNTPYLSIGSIGISGSTSRSVFAVVKTDSYGIIGGAYFGINATTGTGSVYDHCVENGGFFMRVAGNSQYTDADNNLIQRLYTTILTSTTVFSVNLFKDGTQITRTAGSDVTINTNDSWDIGASLAQVDQYYDGKIQEIVVYASNKSTDRSGIETNLNDFYSIY
jgi:hypothetical protein